MNLHIFLQAAPGGGGGMQSMLMIVLIIIVFYFFMIRPQAKRARDEKKFRESIKKGDSVVTVGGLHGRVTDLQERTVTLEIENNVRIKIEKAAISADYSKQYEKT